MHTMGASVVEQSHSHLNQQLWDLEICEDPCQLLDLAYAGFLSGYLLQEYCPEGHACAAPARQETGELGRCDGRRMWGIIAGLTLMSPLLILTLQVEAAAAVGSSD